MSKEQKFFKRNYVDAIEMVIPRLYTNRDLALSGKELTPTSEVINSDISFMDNSLVLLGPTSGVEGTEFSGINTPEGISNFFVKQNNLTYITPDSFERDILNPLNKSWRDFPTEESFSDYLEELLPIISPGGAGFPAAIFQGNTKHGYKEIRAFGDDGESIHLHLLRSLGWFYILNRPRPTNTHNILTDQRDWFSCLNFEDGVEYAGFRGPPEVQGGPGIPGGTGIVSGSNWLNNPLRFNWECPASTVSLYLSGLEDDPFGGNNTNRLTVKYPNWELPPQQGYCTLYNGEIDPNLNENECNTAGGIWTPPPGPDVPSLATRTGNVLRFKHKADRFVGSEGGVFFSFWVRLKSFSASDVNNINNHGQYIRVTHMGNGQAGPNFKFALTPKWQQICMRTYEGYSEDEALRRAANKVIKFFVLQKWTAAGHGSGGEVFNGPADPYHWHSGDEIDLAYPACYVDTLETGLTPRNEFPLLGPDISEHDYLKTSPSGGFNLGATNVNYQESSKGGFNDVGFLAWDYTDRGWGTIKSNRDLVSNLLDGWVTSYCTYHFNSAGYVIPGMRGRGGINLDLSYGGTTPLITKNSPEPGAPAGIRHDLSLESGKTYKLTFIISKQGDHFEPDNVAPNFEEGARQVVSMVEFAYSKDYPTSIGSIIDCGEPPQPPPPYENPCELSDDISFHRLWINWKENANEIEEIYSDTHNTSATDYTVENLGSTGWFRISMDLTVDPLGHHAPGPDNAYGTLPAAYGMLTVYPSRNYVKNGVNYSRSFQDPLNQRKPTIRQARVSVGRLYLTDPDYVIPDDYSASGELFQFSYVKRNTNADIVGGPYINSFDPSTTVHNNFMKLYKGSTLNTVDGVKALEEYIWRNYFGTTSPYRLSEQGHPRAIDPLFGENRGMLDISHNVVPTKFLSGAGAYVSGTQNLDKIQTINDVVYSPLYMDRDDKRVQQGIETYFSLGKLLKDDQPAGPLHRLLQAIGFITFDINDQVERLRTLTSIKECPDNLLPYLADIIGWNLYGNDSASWRNQLWNAAELYKKKGSLGGLEAAMNVVIPNNPLTPGGGFDLDNSETARPLNKVFSEYYESYIPRLLYYLLITESSFFKEGNKWNKNIAENLGILDFDSNNKDINIKYIVDHILKKAVGVFYDHFYIAGVPFDVNITVDNEVYLGPIHQMGDFSWMTGKTHTPDQKQLKRVAGASYKDTEGDTIYGMAFNYRGRDYPIPPWEDERFYAQCDISQDLLDFFTEELQVFGVSKALATQFNNYVGYSTIGDDKAAKVYDNSFLFFTSSLETAPNYEEVLSSFDKDKIDYLSMWNGKSSTFDINVSAGNFGDDLFLNAPYNIDDFFASLAVIKDFSPAKSNPRPNVHLYTSDEGGGNDATCERRLYSYEDLIGSLSGGSFLAGYATSSVEMRASSLGGIGGAVDPTYNFEGYGGVNNHRYLSVFKREQVTHLEDALIQGTSSIFEVSSADVPLTGEVGAPSATVVKRNSNRRRDFKNLLPTNGWYRRDGSTMPLYLNTNTKDFSPLGFIASSWKYEDVSSIYDYPAVWESCQNTRNTTAFYGIRSSKTFPCRYEKDMSFGDCNNYQNRDELPSIIKAINSILERQADLEASAIYDLNKYNFDISGSWYDPISVAKGSLTYGATLKDYESPSFGPDFQRLYRDYTTSFEKHGLKEAYLSDYIEGGPNIFSHIYGPLYFNGNLSIDGSAVADTSSSLIASSVDDEYAISFNASASKIDAHGNRSDIGTFVASAATDLFVETYEFRNPFITSGVELVDTSSTLASRNTFSLFKYNQNSFKKYRNQFLTNNTVITQKAFGGLPRVRFSLKNYDQTKDAEDKTNFLLPNHQFKATTTSIFGRDRVNYFNGGKVGIWIHTKPEYDQENNLVFWYWSPAHKWEMQKVSDVSGVGGIQKVKDTYAHIFSDPELIQLVPEKDAPGFDITKNKATLNLIKKDDLYSSEVMFNTNNSEVELPVSYYKKYVELHRTDQDYFIEVFPYSTPSQDLYFLFDNLSVVDVTSRNRVNLNYSFRIPDFTPSLKINSDKYDFYYSDGERAPLHTKIYFNKEGDMVSKYKGDIDKITFGVARQDETKTFYTQVSAFDPSSYYTATSSTPELGYIKGWLEKIDSSSLSPSSVSAVGKTAGTYTNKEYQSELSILPEELINIFRYFNDISVGNASRIQADASAVFEVSGGSRASYRSNPLWDGSAIILESGQYSTVDLDN